MLVQHVCAWVWGHGLEHGTLTSGCIIKWWWWYDDPSSSSNYVLSIAPQKVWERKELEMIYLLYATILANMILFGSCEGNSSWFMHVIAKSCPEDSISSIPPITKLFHSSCLPSVVLCGPWERSLISMFHLRQSTQFPFLGILTSYASAADCCPLQVDISLTRTDYSLGR